MEMDNPFYYNGRFISPSLNRIWVFESRVRL